MRASRSTPTTWLHPNDRDSLERLCRYGARGPLTLERLSRRDDGKLEYLLKKPAPNGATVLVLTPLQLVKRLCALVVKPKVHPPTALRPPPRPRPPPAPLNISPRQLLRHRRPFLKPRLFVYRFADWTGLWVSKKTTDIEDDAARADAPILSRYPLARLYDLFTIQDHARAVVPQVRCPALVAAAEQDHVAGFFDGLAARDPAG